MVSNHAAHKIREDKKKSRAGISKSGYKGIFHKDVLPATIGMYGFIVAFALFSLRIGLMPFLGSRGRQLEVYEQTEIEGEENVDCSSKTITYEANLEKIANYCTSEGITCVSGITYKSPLTCYHGEEGWTAFEENGECVDPYCEGCYCGAEEDNENDNDDCPAPTKKVEDIAVVSMKPANIRWDYRWDYAENTVNKYYIEIVDLESSMVVFSDTRRNKGIDIPESNFFFDENKEYEIKIQVENVCRKKSDSAILRVGSGSGGKTSSYSCSGLNFSQANGIITLNANISPNNAQKQYLYQIEGKKSWTVLTRNTLELNGSGAVAGDKISIAVKLIDDGVGGDCTEWNHDSVPNCTMNGCRIYGAYTVTGNETGGNSNNDPYCTSVIAKKNGVQVTSIEKGESIQILPLIGNNNKFTVRYRIKEENDNNKWYPLNGVHTNSVSFTPTKIGTYEFWIMAYNQSCNKVCSPWGGGRLMNANNCDDNSHDVTNYISCTSCVLDLMVSETGGGGGGTTPPSTPIPPSYSKYDLNKDSKVDMADFSIFLTDYVSGNRRSDFNNDDKVNMLDYRLFKINFSN